MKLKEYMQAAFPGLKLKSTLYHQWPVAIHFEFGKGISPFIHESDQLNPAYFDRVHAQCLSLFSEVFSADDQIFLVTNLYHHENTFRKSNKKMKVYLHYVKDKEKRFQVQQETLPYPFDDEEESDAYRTAQFSLACRKEDIDFSSLFKAISHQDFSPLKPRLHNPYYSYEPDVFFVNATQNIILFMYDDRGCEIIAKDVDAIRPLYEKYRNWVDVYYLEETKRMFE